MSKVVFAGAQRRNRRRVRLSDDQRAEMISLWRVGVSSEAVAEKFGVHPAYVRKAAVRAGFRKRPSA